MDARTSAQKRGRYLEARELLRASADISMAPLLAIPVMLREHGHDPSVVLQRAGIEPRAFSDSRNRVPIDAVGRLVDECATAMGCPHFGLLLGIRSGPAATGIAGELMQHAESAHAALRVLIAHLHLHDRSAVLALTSHGVTDVELSYVIYQPHSRGTAHILDASLAIACGVMRLLCGPQWKPSGVMLAHSRPPRVQPYRAFFRAPVQFDSQHSALVFPARDLEQRIADTDPRARARLLQLASELEAARPAAISELTARALSRMVIAMPPTGDKVAQVLGMKRRTLRKRLEAEGTSVKKLLEDVRCELAQQLLEASRMPIGEIAATLHYSKPGAFSRAFKGWTGKTPRAWRKAVGRRARAAEAGGSPLSSV